MKRPKCVSGATFADVAEMNSRHQRTCLCAVWLFIGCVLLTTLQTRVVLADNSADSHSTIMRDVELPPVMQDAATKPRYAGWLLSAYLVPPVVAAASIVAGSGELLISSVALMWLAPTVVHLIAGEYGLAARVTLLLACTAGGALAGGLIGVGVASAVGQSQGGREESPGIHRVIGLLSGGIIGAGVGILTWAIIDVSDAFARDESRRDYARRVIYDLTFSVLPNPGGLTGSLAARF